MKLIFSYNSLNIFFIHIIYFGHILPTHPSQLLILLLLFKKLMIHCVQLVLSIAVWVLDHLLGDGWPEGVQYLKETVPQWGIYLRGTAT